MVTGHSSDFPHGMPGPGQTVSIYPSNTVRDLFYANAGRISKDQMINAIVYLTFALPFTAGWDVHNAFATLLEEDYILEDGDSWVWSAVIPGYQHQTHYVCT